MTDFDFEILAVVAQYGEAGISLVELECNHFKGYELVYNLQELSKLEKYPTEISPGKEITCSFANSNCLEKHNRNLCDFSGDFSVYMHDSYYRITHRGRSLLQNWQRRQNEKRAEERKRNFINILLSVVVGTVTGILATFICQRFLSL